MVERTKEERQIHTQIITASVFTGTVYKLLYMSRIIHIKDLMNHFKIHSL
jgi:hypothetical protein